MKDILPIIVASVILILTGAFIGTIAKECEVCEIQLTAKEKCERTFKAGSWETIDSCVNLLNVLDKE